MTTLIKNGTVVTAGDTFRADILIDGEKVKLIGQNLPGDGHEVIDAEGLLLLPGGIDVHTHLELPFGGTLSSDDFFTGHRRRLLAAPLPTLILPSSPTAARSGRAWRVASQGRRQSGH